MNYGVAVSNGTAALHLCLAAFGIGKGDEVLVPSLTFISTVNAIRYLGASPVFIDIESLTNLSCSYMDAQKKINNRKIFYRRAP